MTSARYLFAVTALLASSCWLETAAAEEATTARKSPTSTIEEITVTARRLEEDIQTTPVAVTAVSPLQMERMHPHDFADLNHIAPNFSIQGSSSLFRHSAIAFARGIGYNNIDGTLDPRLGVSVDGVFYLRNIGVLQNMFDLSAVEIVLGPQGTLFGKNTIAGVMNITTQKPKLDEWEVKGMLRYGNLGRIDSELVANLPLGEQLAARIAFHSQFADGPYNNIYTDPVTNRPVAGADPGGDETKTVRASLYWEPNDQFDLTLIGTILRNDSPSVGGTNEAQPFSLAALWLGHPGFGSPGGPDSRYTLDRSWPSADPFHMDSITVDAKYHGSGFDVIWVSNYMRDDSPENWDDFTYAGLVNNYAIVDHEQYSTELRIQSDGYDRLQWVVGAFYDHGFYDYWQSFYNYIPVLFGLSADPSITNQWIFQKSHSLAGFGQLDFSLTEKLQLNAGIRFLKETKKSENYTGFTGPTTRDLSDWPPENYITAKKSWDKTTYRLGVKYQFNDDLMAYVSYSTGFHSGGFNSAAQAGATVDPGVTQATLGPWEPETADSWEAGVRSQWLDSRLQLNLTGFWTEYKDLQSFSTYLVNPATGLTAVGPDNGGQERARGVELQGTWVPVTGLTVIAAIGYLDAKYTSFDTIRNNQPYDCVEEGCKPVRSPDSTARVTGTYEFVTDVGTFVPTITYSWSDSFYTDTFNNPYGRVNSYGTLDGAIAYEDPTGRWSLSLWGRNITNKHFFTGIVADASGNFPVPAYQTRYYADPRTYGLELRVALGE